MPRVMRVRISTSDGSTSDRPGLQQHVVESETLARIILEHSPTPLLPAWLREPLFRGRSESRRLNG